MHPNMPTFIIILIFFLKRYDVFEKKALGWHTFTYITTRAIPAHGVMLLKLAYSPQYEL